MIQPVDRIKNLISSEVELLGKTAASSEKIKVQDRIINLYKILEGMIEQKCGCSCQNSDFLKITL